ncbi:MAG: glycosyltransferase [Cyanobacteria bacterium P01_A01_bin.114]
MMQLSVIIPCFNAAETLSAQLEALSRQQWDQDWEVIIADNGSRDATVAIAKRYADKIAHLRIVDASDRKGAAYARNYGAHLAAGAGVAFCDADDEVAPGWVAAMGTALQTHDLVAGCCELKKLNQTWAIKARCGGEARDIWVDGLLQSKLSPKYPYASSCNLGVKRAIHKKLGGFDETLLTCEDAEYCRRAQLQGFSLNYVREAIVHYRLRNSLMGIYKQAYTYSQYRVLLHEKYKSTDVFVRPLTEGIMAWRLLAKGLVKIRTKTDVAMWLNSLGWRLGHEAGMKQYGNR